MNIKNKIITAFTLAVLIAPGISFAQTMSAEQLQAEIASLTAQLTQLKNQLAALNGSTSWCYTFNKNLSIGMTGDAVTELQTALQKDGESVVVNGTFDDQTAAAVTSFQEKYNSDILAPYGLSNGTGYAGNSTRAELNSLFKCTVNPPAPVSTSTITLTVSSPNGETLVSGTKYDITFSNSNGYPIDRQPGTVVALYQGNTLIGYPVGTFDAIDSFSWIVGQYTVNGSDTQATAPVGNNYYIQVDMRNGVKGMNSIPFSIVSAQTTTTTTQTPTVTVISPNGGSVVAGNNITVTWDLTGSNSASYYTSYQVLLKSMPAQIIGVGVQNNGVSFALANGNNGGGLGYPSFTVQIPSDVACESFLQSNCGFNPGTYYIEIDLSNNSNMTNPVVATSNAFTVTSSDLVSHTTATLNSFSVTPSSISSDGIVTISYSGSNIGEAKLYVSCPQGVTAPEKGGDVCNQWTTFSPYMTQFTQAFNNTSASSQQVELTLYGYDTSNALVGYKSTYINVAVSTSTATLNSFSVTPSSISSGGTVTISYSGSNIGEAKLYVSCPQGVTAPDKGGDFCNQWTTVSPYMAQFTQAFNNTSASSQQVAFTLYGYDNTSDALVGYKSTYINVAGTTGATPVINSFSTGPGPTFSLSAYNYNHITFQAQCGNFVDRLRSYSGVVSYPTGTESICNAPQTFSSSSFNESSDLSPIMVNIPLALYNAQGVVDGITYISNPVSSNNNGSVVLTVKACNTANVCVSQSSLFPVYAKACLATGTKISMTDGSYKNIEDVKIGDVVKSYGGSGIVAKVIQREDPIITINGTLKAAPDEVVYLASGKTKSANQLKIGDQLLNESGQAVMVATIAQSNKLAKTYDIALKNGNSFFADGYLVKALN